MALLSESLPGKKILVTNSLTVGSWALISWFPITRGVFCRLCLTVWRIFHHPKDGGTFLLRWKPHPWPLFFLYGPQFILWNHVISKISSVAELSASLCVRINENLLLLSCAALLQAPMSYPFPFTGLLLDLGFRKRTLVNYGIFMGFLSILIGGRPWRCEMTALGFIYLVHLKSGQGSYIWHEMGNTFSPLLVPYLGFLVDIEMRVTSGFSNCAYWQWCNEFA